jgi:ketosteroid isomerase-like protein
MTPRIWYPTILVPLALAACSTAPSVDMAAEQQAVAAASDSIMAAESARDIDAVMAFYADDAIMHMEGMPETTGKDKLRAVYLSFMNDSTILSFSGTRSGLEMAPGGGMALDHGINRFQVQGPNGPTEVLGKYIAVWRKQADGWKVAAVAATNDAPPGK